MKETNKNIVIKYDGQHGFIDINTFLTSQFHFLSIINEIQQELFPEEKISIKIKALKEGSFDVEMLFIAAASTYLFNSNSCDILLKMVGTFADVISIAGLLKGEKATSETTTENGQIKIEVNGDNNTVIVAKESFAIYKKNPQIAEALKKNFELLDEDQSVSGLKIMDKDEKRELVSIDRSEFSDMTAENPYLSKEKQVTLKDSEILYIKKPDHFPKETSVSWNFIYDGVPVKARITDQSFIKNINEGERFGQGDALRAKLAIELEWDDKLCTFVRNGKYEIIEVLDIIRRPEQHKLF